MAAISDPTSTHSLSASYAIPKRPGALRRWTVPLAVIGLVGLLIFLLGSTWNSWTSWFGKPDAAGETFEVKPVELSVTLTERGELKPLDLIEVKSEVEGQATLLFLIEESKRVSKGDLLIELASDELVEKFEQESIELGSTRAALEGAKQDLDIVLNENLSMISKAEIALEVAQLDKLQYNQGDFEKEILSADIEIQQTDMDIARKRIDLDKNIKLAESGFVTKAKLDELRLELTKLELTLRKNNLAKSTLLQYERPKLQKQKQSAVDQAEQELGRERKRAQSRERQAEALVQEKLAQVALRENRVARLKRQIERCKIYAPVDGVVQYPNDSMGWRYSVSERLAPGAKVVEGQTLLVLPSTDRMLVTTRIHEADRHKLRDNLPAIVRVTAVPNQTFTGKISKIAKFADSQNRWLNPELKEHATEILLDEAHAKLSPGDSAEIKILIEEVQNVLAVPVQAIFARGRKSYVFVIRNGGVEPVEVKLGRSSTNLIEVVEGLRAGDRVRLAADERMLSMLPEIKQSDERAAGPPREAGPPAGGRRGGGGGGRGSAG